jgi:hypothetical protein
MPFNDKVLLLPNVRELSSRQTEIDIDNAMALCASEVVVVVLAPTTHTIVMGPIRKLDASEQSPVHQFFDRPVDRRPAYAWLDLAELLPEVFHCESRAAAFEIDQAFRNEFARACVALAHLVERRINFLC